MTRNDKNVDKFNEELSKLLTEKVDELKPFFDSIIIFATKHNDEEIGTSRIHHEVGNCFANYGLVKLWIDKQTLERE